MATTKVIEIVNRVEHVLQDANVRWPRVEIQDWLNEAYLTILMARPDANALTGTFTCAAGPRQDLSSQFAEGLRILDVVRNLAAGSDKRTIKLVPRSDIDAQRPDWYAETEAESIQSWMHDPRQPKQFFVYPPATATAQIEVVYSQSVGSHALTEGDLDPAGADTTVILLDDIYVPAITDWVLYRAFSKDAEQAANMARAASHLQAFSTAIGVKSTTDTAASPQT